MDGEESEATSRANGSFCTTFPSLNYSIIPSDTKMICSNTDMSSYQR